MESASLDVSLKRGPALLCAGWSSGCRTLKAARAGSQQMVGKRVLVEQHTPLCADILSNIGRYWYTESNTQALKCI